jgi:hypothetical protein
MSRLAALRHGALAAQPGQIPAVRIMVAANLLLALRVVPLPQGSIGVNILATLLCSFLARGAQRRRAGLGTGLALLALLYGGLAFGLDFLDAALGKVLLSSVLFILVCLSLENLAARIDLSRPLLERGDLWAVTGLALLGLGAEEAVLCFQGQPGRASGLFAEPSHLAMVMAPVLFYLWQTAAGRERPAVALAGLALFLLSPSSTFLFLLLGMAILFRLAATTTLKQAGRLLAPALATGMVLLGFLQTPYAGPTRRRVADILAFSEDSNLSSLVYLNGWMLLAAYLDESRGRGVGFNAMGVGRNPATAASGYLAALDLDDQNAFEGSFTLAKLGSELGCVGIAIWCGFLLLTWQAGRAWFPAGAPVLPANRVALFSLLSMVSVSGVIRSAGYFTGPFVLGLFALFVALSRNLPARPRANPAGAP